MNKFWQNLNERERWMVIAAGFVLASYIFYALLYSPIVENLENNHELLVEKRSTLNWMKQIQPSSIANNKQAKLSNSQLITVIANQLKTSNIKFPYQLQQTGSGEIQISFDKVPFEYVITWLAQLKENYRFTIKQFNAEKTDSAGVTKLLLILNAEG